MQWQRNQAVTVETTTMVAGGAALGRLPEDNRPVFVTSGAPSETAEVRLTKIKRDFAEAEFIRSVHPSPDRIIAPFPPSALAGANWHYLAYPAQLRAKEMILHETLERIGKLAKVVIEPIMPSPQEWRYRNKIELTFGYDANGNVALGFHARGRFDEILPTDDVALFPEVVREIIANVTNWTNREKLTVFHPRTKEGLLRNLVVRRGEQGDDLLINLITTPITALPASVKFLDRLDQIGPSGVLWTENASAATIVRADASHLLEGFDFIDESFLGKTIRYHADSFFQTHTGMAEILAETLLGRLGTLQPEQVIDGYAGVGGFGLFAALQGMQVTSIESHPASSADAQVNAQRLGVADRMTFVNQPMEQYLHSHNSLFMLHNSVLIVDPPRAGLHPKAVKTILESSIDHMFYVSCNPATLARDLHDLKECYQVVFVQPFDLFPQTPHLETLVQLTRE